MSETNTLALYAIRLLNELDINNIPTYQALTHAKLTRRELDHKENLIPQSKYIDLVNYVVSNVDLPCLGFAVGQHTSMLEHGIISYAILSCKNLQESIKRFEQYQNLNGPILTIKLTTEADNAVLSAIVAPQVKWLPPAIIKYFIQEWIASCMQWGKFIGKPNNWFSHIKFGFSEDKNSNEYAKYLNCSFDFNHAVTQVIFPKKHLQLPLNFANHETNELCINQCDKLLKDQKITCALTAEIHLLLANKPGYILSIKEAAATLFMTPRTLHRKLLREKTSYQQIVIKFRLSLAKRYLLETELPIVEISILVGYADHSNFYRTFRKEQNMTPQQFREQINCAT